MKGSSVYLNAVKTFNDIIEDQQKHNIMSLGNAFNCVNELENKILKQIKMTNYFEKEVK